MPDDPWYAIALARNHQSANRKPPLTMQSTFLVILIVLIGALVTVGGFLLGVFAGFRRLPPVPILQSNYNAIIDRKEYEGVPEFADRTDPDALNTVRTAEDVERKRSDLVEFIWRDEGFPEGDTPDEILLGIEDERFAAVPEARIDEYVVEMEHGVDSIAYHFHPDGDAEGLLVYHQGHSGGFVEERETIAHFVGEGYAVLAFSMPLKGMNSRPTVTLDRIGTIRLTGHDRLRYLERKDFSPIKYFLHPVAVGIEHALAEYDYKFVGMIGISGGGWTTHLYAAVDPRVRRSYPIDGALPLHLRMLPPSSDTGDYETEHPDLYRVCNYLELFTLGSYGAGRKQLQILNKHAWAGGGRYRAYEPHVGERLKKLGAGEFEVYVDARPLYLRSQAHQISDRTLTAIKDDIAGLPEVNTP